MNNNEVKYCKHYLEQNFYNEEGECSQGFRKIMCKDIDNCYFKQLLQSQAENERIYNRLYKIKDSQLKYPVNNMEEEDLSIDELLDHIEESFIINDNTYNNLTAKLKKAVG